MTRPISPCKRANTWKVSNCFTPQRSHRRRHADCTIPEFASMLVHNLTCQECVGVHLWVQLLLRLSSISSWLWLLFIVLGRTLLSGVAFPSPTPIAACCAVTTDLAYPCMRQLSESRIRAVDRGEASQERKDLLNSQWALKERSTPSTPVHDK